MKRIFAALSLAAMLSSAACQNLSDPTTVVSSADAAYGAALAAELVWLNSGKADAATVQKIEAYRKPVHDQLTALNNQIAAGQAPTSDAALALQTAVAAYQAYLTANGIQITATTTTTTTTGTAK